MKSKFNSFTSFQNTPGFISASCLVTAIVCRVINIFYFSHVGGDKVTIALFSKNFLEGKGFSIPQYFVADPETQINDPAPLWPPGYPLLLSGLLKLFNYNLYWATTTIDLIAAIALIFIIRNLCILLDFTGAAVNIATLVAGCFGYSFIDASQATDLVTLTLLFFGLYLVIRVLKKPEINIRHLIVTSFFLVLPLFFRYSYHLSVFFLPTCLFTTGWFLKNKTIFIKGRILLLGVILFYFLFVLLQLLISGSAFYVVPTEKGFFPNNLAHWAPFIPASFISMNFVYIKIFSPFLSLDVFSQVIEIINYILAIIFFSIFIRFIINLKKIPQPSIFQLFALVSVCMSTGLLLTLAYIAVAYKEQVYHGVPWSYLTQYPRYFGLITLLIQILFIGWCFSKKILPFKNHLIRGLKYFLALLLVIELTHNFYFNVRLLFKYRQFKQEHYWASRFDFIENIILTLIKNNPDKKILVASYTFPTAPHLATYYGQQGLVDGKTLNSVLPSVKNPSILLVHLPDDELPLFAEFFKKANPVHLSKNDYDNFYIVYLNP